MGQFRLKIVFLVNLHITILLVSNFIEISFEQLANENGGDCQNEIVAYSNCITTGKQTQRWALNRPFTDHASIDHCFTSCGATPEYSRSMFGDFLPIWQQVSQKTWQEFLNTPESVKRCMRLVVRQQTRRVLNSCVQSSGQAPILGGFTEDLELPYCMQETSDETQKHQMKTGIAEKVSILHQLNECKNTRGPEEVKQVIQCIDNVQLNFTKVRFCPLAQSCEKQTISAECLPIKNIAFKTVCSCARYRRDGLLRRIQQMYSGGSLQVLKLTPAFLGLDLTDDQDSGLRLKRCYVEAGLKPIQVLTAQDNQFLNMLRGFKPRPEGYQGILNLVYAQLDLPDVCDTC